jgi:type VI secretion system secreted protein Hcp
MAFDAFLKIEGIEGESLDKNHKDEIEIQSYSWGLANTGSAVGGGGGGSGKAVLQDFHFTTKLSKASPKLMLACAKGEHLKEALLTVRKAGGTGGFEFLKIKLNDILVSNHEPGGEGGSELPTDSFSLSFAKIDFLYTVQRTGEVVQTQFDQSLRIE